MCCHTRAYPLLLSLLASLSQLSFGFKLLDQIIIMSVQSCFQSRPHLVWSVTTILFCFIIDCTYTISRDSSVLSSAWTALVQLVTSYFSLFPLSSPLRHILPFNFRLFWSLQSRLVLFFHFGLRWFRSLRLHPIFFRWIWSSWLHPMFPFILGNFGHCDCVLYFFLF